MCDPRVYDAELCDDIAQRFLRANSHIFMGDYMQAPITLMDEYGNVPDEDKVMDHSFDDSKCTPVQARSIKISLPLSELNDEAFKLPEDVKFILPYQCIRNNVTFKVGDTIKVIGAPDFMEQEVVVTDEIMKAHSFALFRFGVS